MVGGDVLVAACRGFTFGALDRVDQRLRRTLLRRRVAGDGGQRLDRGEGALAHGREVGADLDEELGREAPVLADQRDEKMGRIELRVALRDGKPLGGCDGLLGLDRESVCLHTGILRDLSLEVKEI